VKPLWCNSKVSNNIEASPPEGSACKLDVFKAMGYMVINIHEIKTIPLLSNKLMVPGIGKKIKLPIALLTQVNKDDPPITPLLHTIGSQLVETGNLISDVFVPPSFIVSVCIVAFNPLIS
jgi:hypothetical protein